MKPPETGPPEQGPGPEDRTLAELVLETAPNGIVVMGRDGLILMANPALEEMFGFGPGELIGEPLSTLVPERSRNVHPQLQARFMKNPVGMTMSPTREVEGRRRDGTNFPVDVLLAPLSDNSGAVSAIVRDLTEQKRVEEALRDQESENHQKQRLETVGTLVAGIAHDFNNLLVPILTFTDFLEEHTTKGGKELLAELNESALQARDLCAQILGFARKSKPDFRDIDVAECVAKTVGFLMVTAPSRVVVRGHVTDAGTTLLADDSRLQQVVLNLGTNAIQALGDRPGSITIALGPAESLVPPGRPELILTVEDDGPGIPAALHQSVFQPFFTTRSGNSTGLGLSVVSRIVALHQGRVELSNRATAGARFEIVLPADHGRSPVIVRHETSGEIIDARVLVIDDKPQVVRAIELVLASAGFQVATATSVEEGLSLASATPAPDLIIADYDMPGVARGTLVRELSKLGTGARILLCTGTEVHPKDVLAHSGGIDALLKKPFTPEELRECVGEILRGSDQSDEGPLIR